MPKLTQQLWMKVLLLVGFWSLLGLAFASQFYFSSAQFGSPVSWSRALSFSLADWYVFALLSVPAHWLARRLPVERHNWARAVLGHLGAGLLFSGLYMLLRAGLATVQTDGVTFEQSLRLLLIKSWHFNLLVYGVIVTVSLAFDYYRKFRERELRTAELEQRLTQARLQALQMQLNPHFLFNTLHAISALMHKDVEAADTMLIRLGELLRHALEGTDTQEVPLRDEIHFLQRYAEIEQTRFGERLKIEMKLAPETLEALVPNLVLQPLLENAIRHGIEPRARPGRVEIASWREADALCLSVRDNGGGLPGGALEEGIGLSNTRARLRQLYGEKQEFRLSNAPEGGVLGLVRIPFHTGA